MEEFRGKIIICISNARLFIGINRIRTRSIIISISERGKECTDAERLQVYSLLHYCKARPPKNIRTQYYLGVKEELNFII